MPHDYSDRALYMAHIHSIQSGIDGGEATVGATVGLTLSSHKGPDSAGPAVELSLSIKAARNLSLEEVEAEIVAAAVAVLKRLSTESVDALLAKIASDNVKFAD